LQDIFLVTNSSYYLRSIFRKEVLVMKKMTLAIITIITAMAMPTMAMAAPLTTAAPAPVAQTPVQVAAPTATTPATTTTPTTDPNKVIVTVNGVQMTQAQARLVILANIKNHTQMTPDEMVAYINDLEAQSVAAETGTTPTPVTPPVN
jgi:flagellar basal body-associated protein FliL